MPDDEAAAHALFEMAVRREPVPPDRQALIALIEKYSVCTGVGPMTRPVNQETDVAHSALAEAPIGSIP